MNENLKKLFQQIISSQKAYKSVKLVNGLLIVVMNDGSTLTKYDATEEDYKQVVECNSLIKIRELMLTNSENDTDYFVGYDPYMRDPEAIIKKRVHEK